MRGGCPFLSTYYFSPAYSSAERRKTRDNKTTLELFVDGVRGWEDGLWRLIGASLHPKA